MNSFTCRAGDFGLPTGRKQANQDMMMAKRIAAKSKAGTSNL